MGISGENRTASGTIFVFWLIDKMYNLVFYLRNKSVWEDLFSERGIYLSLKYGNHIKICNFIAGINIKPGR